MARIVFGIMGEGRGHTLRSKTLLEDLKDRHEIILFGGGLAYEILKDWELPMEEIPILKFGLDSSGNVNRWNTFTDNLPTVVHMKDEIKKVASKIKKFDADLVISDFEPTVSRAAWRAGVRSVCLDNQHILTNCKGDFEKTIKRAIFQVGTMLWSLEDDFYLISNFFKLPVKRHYQSMTRVIPPIVRPDLLELKPEEKDHFLVYQTYGGPEFVTEKLYDLPYKFKAFPAKEHVTVENTEYCPFGTGDFVDLLRTCKGVITNGGHTLISEALFLGKPVLSIPIKGQFEQELNGHYLDKFRYGLSVSPDDYSKEHFEEFVANLDKYKENISKESFCGNQEAIEVIEEQIAIGSK